MATFLPGIHQLVSKLERIQAACGDDPAETKKQKQDDYQIVKTQLHKLLHIVRTNLRERVKILAKHGNNYQAIEKAVRIREMIKEIENLLPKLQQIQMKQARQKRLSEQEIEYRVADIRNICRQLEEAKITLNSNQQMPMDEDEENEVWENSDQRQLHDLVGSSNQVRVGNRSFQKSSDNRELHADEEQAIQRWKERDENFDSMLDQIALVCDRLNPLVHQIGDAAQRQQVMAQDVGKKVDKADADVNVMGGKLKQVLQSERNSDFVCKLILFLVLLTVLGLLAKMMNSKI